jgi:glutamyl-tRNA synthetase
VLRIEDTDRERSTPENVEQILDALRWLELDWDEGPILQSERAPRHRDALDALLAAGHAYRSSATAEDVRAYKERLGADRGFRGEPERIGAVRLRVPDEGATVVHDVIRGETSFEHVHLDDPVIARADGSVLYNFAVAIDDLDAGITHVVRGEDHLSNTPKQLLVLEAAKAVGLAELAPPPLYAHLPLLLGPDGKKLSKRHGAASVQELRDAGYLPEAVRNYLALLGWGAGDDATVLSTDELVRRFSLERVSRNPARFDEAKLRWLNGLYIRALQVGDLARRLQEFVGREDLEDAARISQEKIHTLADFWPLAGPLFDGPVDDPKARERWLGPGGRSVLAGARDALAQEGSFDEAAVKERLESFVRRSEMKPGEVYQPLRVALTGSSVSPGIFESVALLGREETLRRIDSALAA